MAVEDQNISPGNHYDAITPGTIIKHYIIVSKIGAGGMGEVYLADDTRLNRKVALKFLPSKYSSDTELISRFKREAQAAAALNHPNIVTIYEVGEYNNLPFFVMEHVEGHSLDDLIENDILNFDEIISIAVQVCEGLSKAHKSGITHRDIKSSNIIIDSDKRTRILDFGLAVTQKVTKLTTGSTTLGTLCYMSPEQASGKDVTSQSDLWSLGVILYEMLTGQMPFRGEYNQAVMYAIFNEDPEILPEEVPDGFQIVINKALEKDPELRYKSAEDFLSDLKKVKKSIETGIPFKEIDDNASIIKKKKNNFKRNLIGSGIIIVIVISILIIKPWQLIINSFGKESVSDNRLAVMYFENLIDPDDPGRMGEILTNLLITDLSESKYIKVVSSQRLYDVMKLLGKEGEKSATREIATQAAEKAGAKWMLLGSILQIKPRFVVTSQLVDVQTGQVEAAQQLTGDIDNDIFSIVDKLTVEIRKDLSLPAEAEDEPDLAIADVTTHSPDAYRYYLIGMENLSKHYWSEAEHNFAKAIEYDSTFAIAYYELAWRKTGEERKRLADQADKYSDNITQKEKSYLKLLQAEISGDDNRYVEILKDIVNNEPDDKNALFQLGRRYMAINQLEKAINVFLQSTEIDPLFKDPYNELAYVYNDLGDFEKSIWAINKYIELAPKEPNPYDSKGELYCLNGKLDEAVVAYKKALGLDPDFILSINNLGNTYLYLENYPEAEKQYQALASYNDKNIRSIGRLALAGIPLYQGKFKEALRILEVGIESDRLELGNDTLVALKLSQCAMVYGVYLRDYKASVKKINEAIEVAANTDKNTRLKLKLMGLQAYLYIKNNEITKGDSVLNKIENELQNSQLHNPDKLNKFIIAMISLAKKEAKSAARSFEQSNDVNYVFCDKLWIARGYLEAGRFENAVNLLEEMLSKYNISRVKFAADAVIAYYYLGQAYEESGWNHKAIEQYEKFLGIWGNADEGILEINDARERLKKLQDSI